ncbi:MAG: DNA repair protein RecN [Bacteroidota bacterium]|nr:DNA repair protein RecN [Bacteroidota bacterium]
MLLNLKISNYAIISKSEICFGNGLNIITGETGAGKSILMGALGLILGERADSKTLLQGADKCVVEAIFDIGKYQLQNFFEAHELDYELNCIIRREVNAAGKSRAFINDTPVNLPVLKQLGFRLVDIVSQHQTLELNEADFQLEVLDAIAQTEHELLAFKNCYQNHNNKQKQLKGLLERETKSRQDEDYLRFVLNELNELAPKDDEQDLLELQMDSLSHADIIQQATGQVSALLEGNEQSVADILREAKSNLTAAAKHHPQILALQNRLESNIVDIKDIAAELLLIAEKTLIDPQALQQIENRLQLIVQLQKKHRVNSNTELIALQEKFKAQFLLLGSLETAITEVRDELKILNQLLIKSAQALSKKRTAAIASIEQKVNELLQQVAMPNARLQLVHYLLSEDKWNENGSDEITFMFSANKGFALQPMNKVASGGELSRLMLCIKSLIADKVHLPTIVFDEIDSGISGEAAQRVASVMKAHAKNHQVLAISHLPQIAGKADVHFYVYKNDEGKQSSTQIKMLEPNERVEEIARMLSGENPSEKVLAAAKELMGTK